jgi:stage V sporulation protein D (sporulation-specific penicillin-binding protein)
MVIGIEDDVKRYYPYGSFACAVLGFTGIDGDGRAGLEMYYESELAGTPGRILTARNGNNDVMPMYNQTVYEAKPGANLVLTIDESVIQRHLEKKGHAQVYDIDGQGAYGIVMDVQTRRRCWPWQVAQLRLKQSLYGDGP